MSLSLTGSINTDKVRTGDDKAMASLRFQDPAFMSCPIWNQEDSFGRSVSINSFAAKTEGCQSASDIVNRENAVRPRYMNYTTLDARAIYGDSSLPNQYMDRRQQAFEQGTGSLYGRTGVGLAGIVRMSTSQDAVKDMTQPRGLMNRMEQSSRVAMVNGKKYAMSGAHY